MKPGNWKDRVELIGIVAVLASLIFVGLQLKQAELIALTELESNDISYTLAMNQAIADHVDIWIRGKAGEELDAKETEIFTLQLVNINNRVYFGARQNKRMKREQIALIEVGGFAAFLYENPGARRAWLAREQMMARQRAMVDPDETFSSVWLDEIQAHWDRFDQQLLNKE